MAEMKDWARFWEVYPKRVGGTDFLEQVGKTVKGQPITDVQFKRILSQIGDQLHLEKDDTLLDLCCGNGLITKELGRSCRMVVGIDFSQPLVDVANQHHQAANVVYQRMNVLELDKLPPMVPGLFSKVLMYEALQNFRKQDLKRLLENVLKLSSRDVVILLGSIPDHARKWRFYNTPKRKLAHLARRMLGTDPIGTWWKRGDIHTTCKQFGLQCKFQEQHKELHTSHYRFDAVMFRTENVGPEIQ